MSDRLELLRKFEQDFEERVERNYLEPGEDPEFQSPREASGVSSGRRRPG